MPMSSAAKALAGGVAAPVLVALGIAISPGNTDSAKNAAHPHVDHVTLPLHKSWTGVLVAYGGSITECSRCKRSAPVLTQTVSLSSMST